MTNMAGRNSEGCTKYVVVGRQHENTLTVDELKTKEECDNTLYLKDNCKVE